MVKGTPLPGGKKSRKEKKTAPTPDFSPIKIEISDPLTLILLLETKENVVLVQVLSALVHYASQSEECGTKLVQGGILPYLLPMIHHEDQCCQRYIYRLIAHLVFHKNAKSIIFEDKMGVFNTIFDSLVNSTDVVLKEYSSKILSILCNDEVGCAYLNDICSLETLNKCLSISDPDIEKNVLEMMVKYLKDPSAKPSREFNFQPVLQLTMSEYPVIQNLSFDVISALTDRCKDINLKQLFKNANGVEKLMSILERSDWSDLHSKVLHIIGNLAEAQDQIECIKPNDIRRLINYIAKSVDVNYIESAWYTVIKLANTESGRKVLKDLHVLEKLLPMLRTEGERLPVTACIGLVKFMEDYDTMEEISVMNPVPALLSLVKRDCKWKTKGAALTAIKEGLKRHIVFHQQISNNYLHLQKYLEFPSNEVPAEIFKSVLECLTLLAEAESFRHSLDSSIIQMIVKILQETEEDSVRIAAFNLLSQLIFEEKLCKELRNSEVDAIWNTIIRHTYCYQTATAAAHFVETASKNNQSIALAFIKTGALYWMLHCKDLQRAPTWESAITVLISSHLSSKFAYRGRLDFTDIIKDPFYARKEGLSIEKQMTEKFPVYDEVIQIGKDENQKPIYLVNFSNPTPETPEKSSSIISNVSKRSGKAIVVAPNQINDMLTASADSIQLTGSLKTSSAFKKDYNLSNYIEQVKKLLQENDQLELKKIGDVDSALSASDTEARAKIIGTFVCNQLSGPDPKVPCTTHYLNLHIEELKAETGSSLIPIGLLRAGLAMERAILFKVLADQVGLPCALVRGQCHQGWVEVSLPVLSPPPTPCLPITLLKPTHIVDLLHAPVTLLSIGSFAANKYSTCPSLSAYTSLTLIS